MAQMPFVDRPQNLTTKGKFKPALGDVETILDPMLNDNYEFFIPVMPRKLIRATDGPRMLRLYCKSVTKPGIENAAVDVDLYGHKLKFSGRTTFDNTLTVEFVENRNGEVIKLLEDWHEIVRNAGWQLGEYKDNYEAPTAEVVIVDQPGQKVAHYILYNIFPTTLPEMQFSGDDAQIITQSITFSYDWWEAIGKKYSNNVSQASGAGAGTAAINAI